MVREVAPAGLAVGVVPTARRMRASVRERLYILSGGQTMTQVPLIVSTTPPRGENVYGAFTARARAAFAGPDNTLVPNQARITLRITRSGKTVFSASNVDTTGGVKVSGLQRGTYTALWTLIDANGDTRTVVTQFIEQR
jgi:hypothetical protein